MITFAWEYAARKRQLFKVLWWFAVVAATCGQIGYRNGWDAAFITGVFLCIGYGFRWIQEDKPGQMCRYHQYSTAHVCLECKAARDE